MKNNKQWTISNDCYGNLAQAIIYQAASDYVHYRRKLYYNRRIRVSSTILLDEEQSRKFLEREIERLKRFFLGRWFAQLNTEIDGKELLRKLDLKFEKSVKNRKKTVDK